MENNSDTENKQEISENTFRLQMVLANLQEFNDYASALKEHFPQRYALHFQKMMASEDFGKELSQQHRQICQEQTEQEINKVIVNDEARLKKQMFYLRLKQQAKLEKLHQNQLKRREEQHLQHSISNQMVLEQRERDFRHHLIRLEMTRLEEEEAKKQLSSRSHIASKAKPLDNI